MIAQLIIGTTVRVCVNCREIIPPSRHPLTNTCGPNCAREHENAYLRDYRKKHIDRFRARRKALYRTTRDESIRKASEYYRSNKAKIRRYYKRHYENNRQAVINRVAAYYKANRDKILSKTRSERKSNPEPFRIRDRARYKSAPDKFKARVRLYCARTGYNAINNARRMPTLSTQRVLQFLSLNQDINP